MIVRSKMKIVLSCAHSHEHKSQWLLSNTFFKKSSMFNRKRNSYRFI